MPTYRHLQLRIALPLLADKHSQDRRLRSEIAQMRALASIVSEVKGTLVCEGPHGRCEVQQKEAIHFDAATDRVLRHERFRSNLYAVHRALCWSVMGMFENQFGEMQ